MLIDTRLAAAAITVVAALGLAAAPAVAAPARGMTHKVTISGEFVNHWTTSQNEECSPLGGGTVTVKFRTSTATAVRPFRHNYRPFKWMVAIPHGRNLQGMKHVKAPGTITREDNTTPRPFPEGSCIPSTRLGCGTFPLARKPFALVRGYDSRRISVHFANEFQPGPDCLIGEAKSWQSGPQRLLGGDREGKLLVDMPRESAFKRRRVVSVSGQTHKTSRYSDGPLEFATNDLTRKATVTFTRR